MADLSAELTGFSRVGKMENARSGMSPSNPPMSLLALELLDPGIPVLGVQRKNRGAGTCEPPFLQVSAPRPI